MANDYNSVLATCQRFQDIATWDPEHFNANGALARIAELHKHELAAKDAEIARLKRENFDLNGCLLAEQESVEKRNALIKELADALVDATQRSIDCISFPHCKNCNFGCEYARKMSALVAKAREVVSKTETTTEVSND